MFKITGKTTCIFQNINLKKLQLQTVNHLQNPLNEKQIQSRATGTSK